MIRNAGILVIILGSLALASGGQAADRQPIPVRVEKAADGQWTLIRNGQPYRIRGAGGEGSLELLAQCGGNSTRTWGVDAGTRQRLDQAHQHGLTVAVGIWLEQSQKGFDYGDPQRTSGQVEKVLAAVQEYKDHPAVLVWGLGNEMEGYDNADRPEIWRHIEALAKAVKQLDPHHPTMTVVAEITDAKLAAIEKYCPSLDIVGINSYGGCGTLAKRYTAAGGTKPFIVTEFGPVGTWEVAKNNIDAIVEPTSGDKATQYRKHYRATMEDAPLCLGSYAFLWGNKQEGTATWFGMLLANGMKTAAVDTMMSEWTGAQVANRVPEITVCELVGRNDVAPEATVEARLTARDPEGAPLQALWSLLREADSYVTGGDFQQRPPEYPQALVRHDTDGCVVRMPAAPGLYRLYVEVNDGEGAATANIPIRVTAADLEADPPTPLPYVVYDEATVPPEFIPSGWMGNHGAMGIVPDWKDRPKSGATCMKCEYRDGGGWGGVAWQSPEGDWGARPGGKNFSGAKRLSFWARGAQGGETVKIGFGLLGRDKPFFDTTKKELEFQLEREWKQFSIPLEGDDLRRIKTPFFWVVASRGAPMTFFFDDIRVE